MRHPTTLQLAIIALALLAALLPQRGPARSQDVFRLLKDMNPGTVARATKPQDTAVLGGAIYFITDDGWYGGNAQLWKTDGTNAGTTLIMDFPVNEIHEVYQLQTAGDQLYFLADSSFYGIELWTSDGTAAGTHMVANITPSYQDSFTNYGADIDLYGHFPGAALGRLFYFSPDNLDLWSTDGTEAGTKKVLSPSGGISNLRVIDNKLYILNSSFTELWVSNTTEAGTQKLADLSAYFRGRFFINNSYLTSYKNKNYFLDNSDDNQSVNLWSTDGTPAGTSIISHIPESMYSNSTISTPVVIDNKLTFLIDGSSDTELWTSDGTSAGTMMLASLPDGYISPPLVINGKILFTLTPHDANQTELWSSDGTISGTKIITTLDSNWWDFTVRASGNKAILCADKCWGSDGTLAGTTLLSDNAVLWLNASSTLNGALIAPLKSGSATSLMARTDGTAAGTSHFFSATQPADSSFLGTPLLGNTRYIVTSSGLWETDGTTDGTKERPEIMGQLPSKGAIVAINQIQSAIILQERHWDGKHYIFGVWRTDGTVEGTSLITNIGTDIVVPNSLPMTVANNVLYIIDPQNKLWSSDGTPAGTKQVASVPTYDTLLAVGTDFLIIDSNVSTATHVYKFDPNSGTIAEIMQSNNSDWGDPSVIGKSAYWNISSDDDKVAQWRYDQGTSKPVQITSHTTAISAIYINSTFVWDNKLTYVLGGDTNSELWQSASNTAAPTKLLDIPHAIESVMAAGSYIYFETGDYVEAEGYIKRQLWRTDGTKAGTIQLLSTSQIRETNFYLQKAIGSTLYFTAYTPATGTELWRSDGTAAGTALYADINPGGASSDPKVLLELGGTLLVQATTQQYGRELYVIDTPIGSERLYLPLAAAQ